MVVGELPDLLLCSAGLGLLDVNGVVTDLLLCIVGLDLADELATVFVTDLLFCKIVVGFVDVAATWELTDLLTTTDVGGIFWVTELGVGDKKLGKSFCTRCVTVFAAVVGGVGDCTTDWVCGLTICMFWAGPILSVV